MNVTYSQRGQTDRQMGLLWHRPYVDSLPKRKKATKMKNAEAYPNNPRRGPKRMYAMYETFSSPYSSRPEYQLLGVFPPGIVIR